MAHHVSPRRAISGRSPLRPHWFLALTPRPAMAGAVAVGLCLFGGVGTTGTASSPAEVPDAALLVNASLRGSSGKLFARFVTADSHSQGVDLFRRLFGVDA